MTPAQHACTVTKQGSSELINIFALAWQRFAGVKDGKEKQHTGIIPPNLLAAQVSPELTARSSFFCLPPLSALSRPAAATNVVPPHLLAVLVTDCPPYSDVEKPGWPSLHLTISAFSKERFPFTLTAAIAGHLLCQHPHRLASCYMRFYVDCWLALPQQKYVAEGFVVGQPDLHLSAHLSLRLGLKGCITKCITQCVQCSAGT